MADVAETTRLTQSRPHESQSDTFRPSTASRESGSPVIESLWRSDAPKSRQQGLQEQTIGK
jgi:hypothetical protein